MVRGDRPTLGLFNAKYYFYMIEYRAYHFVDNIDIY